MTDPVPVPSTWTESRDVRPQLLGKVIERASGKTFTTYVSDQILRPLAIAPQELGYAVADPAHHATGYREKYP